MSVLHVWQCLCALPWESVCMTELKTAHPRDPFESNLSSNLFFAHIPIQLPFPTVRVCFTIILFNSSKLSKPWKKAVKCILAPGVDTYHGLILVKAITWRFVFLTILIIEISIILHWLLLMQKHNQLNKAHIVLNTNQLTNFEHIAFTLLWGVLSCLDVKSHISTLQDRRAEVVQPAQCAHIEY